MKDGIWIAYTSADGFLDEAIGKPYRASNGDLWFRGTRGGRTAAARYDGSTWQIFTQRDGLVDAIRNVMEGRDGSIWF